VEQNDESPIKPVVIGRWQSARKSKWDGQSSASGLPWVPLPHSDNRLDALECRSALSERDPEKLFCCADARSRGFYLPQSFLPNAPGAGSGAHTCGHDSIDSCLDRASPL
jgi:hypothetical protein